MARSRADTATLTREGHGISLKVLRLSRPSLTQQTPLSKSNTAGIPQEASLAYPSKSIDGDFVLTPILSLPPSFGSAYIGETFSCAIVANNELDASRADKKSISDVRLVVEMQTPSQTLPLGLLASPGKVAEVDEHMNIEPGSSIQRIIEFPLREEGNHTLIVAVFYTETTTSTSTSSGSPATTTQLPSSPAAVASPSSTSSTTRTRTFRKMYQFPTTPCLSVRTKATELPPVEMPEKLLGDPYARVTLLRYALEAQLENVSETRITLENAQLIARPPFKATSLNGVLPPEKDDEIVAGNEKPSDGHELGTGKDSSNLQIVLQPRSVHQLLFLVLQQLNVTAGLDELKANLKTDGRTVLGQIALEWRSAMGEKGILSTGNLMTRRKQ